MRDITQSFRIVNNQTKLPRFKYKCYICSETFITHLDLVSHKAKFKNNGCKEFDRIKLMALKKKRKKQKQLKKDIYSCKLCLKVFLTKRAFYRHKHVNAPADVIQVPDIVTPTTLTNECVVRDKLTNKGITRSRMVVSYQEHPPNEIISSFHFSCSKCDRNFLAFRDLQEHVIKTRCLCIGKCKTCSAFFDKNWQMYAHVVRRHPHQHICEFCYKIFSTYQDLTTHKCLKHFKYFQSA